MSEGPDHLVLAEILDFVANRLMTLDADQLYGVSAERKNHRNGYREKAWETHADWIDLKPPKLRRGLYFPEFLEPQRVVEQPRTAVIYPQLFMRRRDFGGERGVTV